MKFNPSKIDDVSFEQFTGRTAESMKFIAEHGVSDVSKETLLRAGHALIRTAKKRIRELEMAGYTDVPAYRYYKNNIKNFSLAGANLNKARHIVMETYKFLLSKTSTVEGASKFLSSTVEKWAGHGTTREQREKLFDLFDRLEKEHPSWFSREAYSSAELAADIYIFSEVLDAKDWNIDEAYNVLNIQAGEMFLFDKDLNEDANERVSDWIYRKMANA